MRSFHGREGLGGHPRKIGGRSLPRLCLCDSSTLELAVAFGFRAFLIGTHGTQMYYIGAKSGISRTLLPKKAPAQTTSMTTRTYCFLKESQAVDV